MDGLPGNYKKFWNLLRNTHAFAPPHFAVIYSGPNIVERRKSQSNIFCMYF